MRVVAIVQARMGSTRLPNKVMLPIGGTPMIGLLLSRLSLASRLDQILLATSTDGSNDPLAAYVAREGYEVHRGSETDVLDRFYDAARLAQADTVVRITGDCPLIDPSIVDAVVDAFEASGADYASNVAPPTFPDGLDTEVFSFPTLASSWRQARAPKDREHVTPFMRESGHYTTINVSNADDLSAERWTVDSPADYDVVRAVFEHFHPGWNFGWRDVLALRRERPDAFAANRHLLRNEGLSTASDRDREPGAARSEL